MKTEFYYVCSSELSLPVGLRVVSLFGYDRLNSFSGEMFIKISIYCNQRSIGPTLWTRYKPARTYNSLLCSNNEEIKTWDEWIDLPVTYAELTSDALLHIMLWDVGKNCEPVFVAQCSKYLFSKHGFMRSGQFDLRLQRALPGETPSPLFTDPKELHKMPRSNSINNLLKKEKLHRENYMDVVPWLDRITFAKLETSKQNITRAEDRSLYLTVEMRPVSDAKTTEQYKVLFYAPDTFAPGLPIKLATSRDKQKSFDPEMDLENLCETKHHMLTRNVRAGDIDRRLQPNSMLKDMLETIIRMPALQPMSMEDRDMIWKFRFWLKSKPFALTHFVRSVNWEEKLEAKQAIQVMREWEPIDACDALELLGPTFTHPFVRRYAVWRLQTTPVPTLLLYLPQLVQSLRYEAQIAETARLNDDQVDEYEEDAPLLVSDSAMTPTCSRVSTEPQTHAIIEEFFGGNVDMATFLVDTACRNREIANFLYWYLKVEVEANATSDKKMSYFFSGIVEKMKAALNNGSSSARNTLYTLTMQTKFVDTLNAIARQVAESGGNRAKKLDILKRKLAESQDLMDLKGLALPLDPSIYVKNVQPETTLLFSSKLMPMRLTFSMVRNAAHPFECCEGYMTIFKRGDDLRQDQLVLQMIRLMDNLLKEEKLDLCLTPYAVLATSVSDGFVQYVKAAPIADLKGGILETLRMYRPSSSGPYGIEADVIENYVRSCAGYSMICYVLGIGDRHMHNLLLCENGRMFHVDFGYILGRDPKPMPPPMKLTTEMINAMGGQNSEHFKKFIDYCTTGFLIIRRHANLIINLFSLMLDAGIPDIAIEKEKAVHTILERFHLTLTDDDACKEINRVIQSSISAKMPLISDFVHDVRQMIG